MPDTPPAPQPPSPGPPADGDGAAAPLEMGPRPDCPPSSPPPRQPREQDDLEFILCEGCRRESPHLKLLTCLHTLCLDCLSENKPVGQCPVCWTPIPQANGIPTMDNLLFANLQARLKVYRKINRGEGPGCSRCERNVAAVWCPECEDFLCAKCFEDHQWFFKKKNHEAKRVEDLRSESAHCFLESTRKSCSLFCSTPGHASKDFVSSIYCRQCQRALCCSCALLDGPHTFCDIGSESQRRREELDSLARQLGPGRSSLEGRHRVLREEAARLEREQQEMRELIRQRVEELVRALRREEEELVRAVERRQEQGRQELERELRRLEGALKRMEAGERLVEKLSLYGTAQEVMDMQPFIKASLEELQRLEPAELARERVQPGDLGECRARLQALVERVMGRAGTNSQAAPVVEVALENDQQEEVIQPTFTISLRDMHTSPTPSRHISPKRLKLESDNRPGPSNPSSNQWDGRTGPGTPTLRRNCSSTPATNSHSDDAEDTSIIISSEDSEEDTVAFSKPHDSEKPSSPPWSESGTSPHHSTGSTSPWDVMPELSTLVFLSLKVDQKTQHITEVAATSGEHTFKMLIQTPESVLALLSQGVTMEVGMQNLLWYLSSVPRPILIVNNFWGPELLALFRALDATGRKVDFCHLVSGYVDMLSLIKEKLPRAPSYKLKDLVQEHLEQQVGVGSTLARAKALQKLWWVLGFPAQPEAGMLLTHCALQSYSMLQPVVQKRLLTRRAAKILARHHLIFWKLKEVQGQRG
ncbi:protein PML isoform X2 [Calypte anna]|uniref:protein PML isoform X2 n=1 Tax=Calypte anna TaxID=9244 RepID=UPI0011C34B1F|nr:protein PML isoform X2 [Calypte anna]